MVGPFLPAQILEMKQKGYVHGLENCQLFPSGDWLPLNQFEFWSNAIDTSTPTDGTFVINLGDLPDVPALETVMEEAPLAEDQPAASEVTPIESGDSSAPPAAPGPAQPGQDEPKDRRKKSRPQSFVEFDYRQAINRKEESRLFELEDYSDDPEDLSPLIARKAQQEKEIREDSNRIISIPQKALAREQKKAKAVDREAQKREIEEAKTTVTPAGEAWRRELEEQKRQQEEIRRRWEEEERARQEKKALTPVLSEEVLRDGATEVINLTALTELKSEARHAEVDLLNQQERELEVSKRKEDEAQRELLQAVSAKEENERLEKLAKRKKLFVIFAVVVLALAILFPADEPKKGPRPFVPVDPVITYPVPFDQRDAVKAQAQLEGANKKMRQDTYSARRDAAILYRASYENDISQRQLIPKLIRLYGWLIPHSAQFERDGNVVFKLARANKLLLDVDPDVCLGTALFYRALGKTEASFNVLDRFVKSKSNKPSKELFAAYLESLVERNDEVVADEVAASLQKVEKPGVEVSLALIRYHRFKNHPEVAREVLDAALEQRANSVPLLIARAEFELEAGNVKALSLTIGKIREQQAEGSRLYFGRVMEFAGFMLAMQNKPGPAAAAFREALKYSDAEILQDKLTNIKDIDPGANDEASRLLQQIKARELVKQSVNALKSFDFENGLLYAINAEALDSGYTKATYHLAAVQLRLGMAKDALDTLERLQKENPGDKAANLALLTAYIDTYKFNDAKRMFTVLAASPMRESWQYASLNARMYEKMGDINQSILWLQKAINLNPLNDEDIFSLAKLLTRAKNFRQAKNRLFQAMELDPGKIEYKLAYGAIIYETEGPDAAIAYLFGLLQQFPKNPSILGDIAIYYYRAGKTQQFSETRKDIEALPVQDPRVYRFLIRSATLDEKWEDAVRYTEELIKLEPGDLNAMMEMGRVLMSIKRYRDAAAWFVRVRDKLPSYPKVGYYKALIELYVGNADQALKDVGEDLKLNGQYEEGLVLVGDIYRSQEKYTEAEGQYKLALKINTRSPGAMRGLASLALKRGALDQALDLFKRALVEDKDNPEIHRSLGDVYRLQGQALLAIESYKVYLKLRPDAPDRPEVDNYIRVLE